MTVIIQKAVQIGLGGQNMKNVIIVCGLNGASKSTLKIYIFQKTIQSICI